MASRLSKWKMKTLSIGGRLTLLKSVLGSMPIYHMSIFKVPMKILQRMDSIRSHFFNGSDPLAKKPTWVKWTNVLASKEKDGLRISSLYALNRALMFKWVCRFLSQNSSLLANVIKSIHGDHEKIGKQVKVSYPYIWLDIVKEVDLAYALESCKNIDVASKLSQNSLAFTFRREPKRGVEQDQFDSLKAMVEAVPIKVNVLAWKIKLDNLPTRLNISRRGMDIDSILCPTCGKAVESTRHIFFTCQIARDILHLITSWWNIPYMEVSSYEEWLVWILSLRLSIKHKRIFEGVCYVTWWHIWNFRNKTIFGSESPSKAAIFDEVQSRSFYWCRYRCKAYFSWIEWLKNPHLVTL
ncbi:RNA-directed DNA polymerase, eukaryota, reverse transcriptase zinc-binding domain protein [Tanacetum coccineum]|uniref:RNA-directed DNA polymerase, eukaryota, reverse transcriptase zinc-binding domain protein n=1 Tax=Tanacetum coccineum TaxID=301880 RepID=A0ABQ4WAF4_9ASTR